MELWDPEMQAQTEVIPEIPKGTHLKEFRLAKNCVMKMQKKNVLKEK